MRCSSYLLRDGAGSVETGTGASFTCSVPTNISFCHNPVFRLESTVMATTPDDRAKPAGARMTGDGSRPVVRFSGLVAAAGTIIGVSTLFAALAPYSWFFDLFSHFRLQYLLGLSLAAVILLRRQRWWAGSFALLAFVNLAAILPLYFGSTSESPYDGRTLCAVHVNVNTRHGSIKRTVEMLRRFDPELIVLAEVDERWIAGLDSIQESYPFRVLRPRSDNFGIALLSKLEISDSRILQFRPAYVPSIVATLETDRGPLTVIATHPVPPIGRANSEARNQQLNELARLAAKSTNPVVLFGDLNITPWSPHFRRLRKQGMLRDSMQGYGIQPSWPAQLPFLFIPIDHCLHSEQVRVIDRRLGPHVASDHLPIVVDFVLR